MKNSLKLAFLTIFSLTLAVFSANAQNNYNSGKVQKTFNWNYNNQVLSFDVWLEAYPKCPPIRSCSDADFYAQIFANADNYNIDRVNEKLVAWGQTMGLNDSQQAELTIKFFQNFRYIYIPIVLTKFPDQTMLDGSGDCDDLSVPTYYCLKKQGYSVALIAFHPDTNARGEIKEGHLAVGLGCPKNSSLSLNNTDGAELAYVELTMKLPIGVIPQTLIGRPYTILLHERCPKMYAKK